MSLIALQMPDTPEELALWLEQQLLGLELGELVAQLTSVHGEPAVKRSLDQVLGRSRRAVLERGLAVLAPTQLQQLLLQPQLLLDLQERVCIQGQDYWRGNIPMAPAMRDSLTRLLFSVHGAIQLRKADPSTARRPYRAGIITNMLRIVAVAALVAVAFGTWQVMERRVSVAVAWGWMKPQATADDVDALHFRMRTADLVHEWFDRRPQTREALAEDLSQLQLGCTRLILAPKKSLSPAEAKWLTDKCRDWSAKVRVQMARLEKGEDDPIKVRDDVDAIIRKVEDALRRGPDA